MKEAQSRHCAACDQPVNESEALYVQEVGEKKQYFCSLDCRNRHERKSAPAKQDLEESTAGKSAKS